MTKRRKVGRPPAGVNGMKVREYPQVSIRVQPRLKALYAKRVKPLTVGQALLRHMKAVGGVK